MLRQLILLAVLGGALSCSLVPDESAFRRPKSPGDNHFKIIMNKDQQYYIPGQRYDLTLVGFRTHDRLQQFNRFRLMVESQKPSTPIGPRYQGQFQLFADTLSRFDQTCLNTVVEAEDLPKTEIQVMWVAPQTGAGCLNIKALVMEKTGAWYAEDGQLTLRLCEDTSKPAPDCCACDDAKYKMVFEGIWSPQTHPKDFPDALWLTHFSDVIGATHPTNFSFWGEGQIATDGFRMLAEWGSPGVVEQELQQHGNKLRSIVKAAGLWHPRVNSNTSATFVVDRRRHLLSVASMFGPSPDWVVGVNSLELCQRDCTWKENVVVDLFPYDAGTDSGISYMSPNSETTPREKMYRITPMYPEDPRAPFYSPGAAEVPAMARLYLYREKLISRSCDEEVLQQLVAEVSENTEVVNRPECAVTEWGEWSPCSVPCGKGLRMRTREYRMQQKAQMFSCDRQLVSKEMCVALIAECEDSPPETSVGVADGVCTTTDWGSWSECSATCGVGFKTRYRRFTNHMGLKKCPLIATEEKQKCMEPPCQAGQEEVSDPTCPTTPWSAWSPCSASCGRGMRLRTRLLLVEPQRQEPCAARVELLQQKPCVEREDCTIDMATAKQICMESTEPGPCRGLYQRWSFMPMKGMCVPFQYGGCRGNRNNFLTQEDCTSTCKVVADAIAGVVPQSGSNGLQSVPAETRSGLELYAPLRSNSNSLSGQSAQGEETSTLDCRISEWSGWSTCSVSCGVGFQQRTRTIIAPALPGGDPCPARLSRRRRCSRLC